MAKGRSGHGQRDASDPSLDPSDGLLAEPVLPSGELSPDPPDQLPLTFSEDLRTFNPSPRAPRTVEGRTAEVYRPGQLRRIVERTRYLMEFPERIQSAPHRYVHRPMARVSSKLGFDIPKQVIVCIRRKTRTEVLFAKRRTRKGAGANRRRNEWSDFKC